MDFLQLAQDRFSCRKLSDRPVEKEKIEAILKAAFAAPTAKNIQPVRIWVVTSPEGVENINSVTSCGFGATTFFVVGCDENEGWVRPFDGRKFADIDGGIVATHIMLAAHDLGLRSTWVGFFDAPKLKEIYPEMADHDLVAIFPVGYAAEDAEPAPRHFERKPEDEIVKYL